MNISSSHSAYPISQFLSYDKFFFPYTTFAISIKLLLFLSDRMLRVQSSKLQKLTLHGLSPICLQENVRLVVNGCTKSNTRKMSLLKGIKLAWWQKTSLNKKWWILLILFLPLPCLLLSKFCLPSLSQMVGIFLNLMLIILFYMVIYLKEFICLYHLVMSVMGQIYQPTLFVT